TFGIGAGASHHLVRGMARAGEGAAEFIYPGERIESKVLRQLKRALAPALTGVQVDWGGLVVKQAPHRVPPAFADGRLLVYGFLKDAPHADDIAITLRAKSPAGDVAFSVPLSFKNKKHGNLIATLAARTLLRDLEEGASEFHERGSLQRRTGKDRIKEEAVRLGVRYGLTSQWTSFVAVEKRDTPVKGEMQLRRIPVALTRGWGGLDSAPRGLYTDKAITGSFAPPAASLEPRAARGLASTIAEVFRPHSRPQALEVFRPFDALVRLQRADGSWDLNRNLAKAVGKKLSDLVRSLPDFTGDRTEARRAWATALALHWLEAEASDWRDEWELMHTKATAWLARCNATPKSGEAWLTAASRF
ncbi:MAG TPA: hypothetical protein VLK65_09600, partial [Vicinamibacteria bacterium]|nr:hypothetical protein [Vicinamibacteria bacterium]